LAAVRRLIRRSRKIFSEGALDFGLIDGKVIKRFADPAIGKH